MAGGFASINKDSGDADLRETDTETVEMQTARVARRYERSLQLTGAGKVEEAQAELRGLLTDPLLLEVNDAEKELLANSSAASAGLSALAQIKFLATKNLAASLAKEEASAEEALMLYGAAACLDHRDIVLLCHMGTLATKLRKWTAARYAFEAALQLNPRHPVALAALMSLLLRLSDRPAAQAAAEALLAADPFHPIATEVTTATAASLDRNVHNDASLPECCSQHDGAIWQPDMQLSRSEVVIQLTAPMWADVIHQLKEQLHAAQKCALSPTDSSRPTPPMIRLQLPGRTAATQSCREQESAVAQPAIDQSEPDQDAASAVPASNDATTRTPKSHSTVSLPTAISLPAGNLPASGDNGAVSAGPTAASIEPNQATGTTVLLPPGSHFEQDELESSEEANARASLPSDKAFVAESVPANKDATHNGANVLDKPRAEIDASACHFSHPAGSCAAVDVPVSLEQSPRDDPGSLSAKAIVRRDIAHVNEGHDVSTAVTVTTSAPLDNVVAPLPNQGNSMEDVTMQGMVAGVASAPSDTAAANDAKSTAAIAQSSQQVAVSAELDAATIGVVLRDPNLHPAMPAGADQVQPATPRKMGGVPVEAPTRASRRIQHRIEREAVGGAGWDGHGEEVMITAIFTDFLSLPPANVARLSAPQGPAQQGNIGAEAVAVEALAEWVNNSEVGGKPLHACAAAALEAACKGLPPGQLAKSTVEDMFFLEDSLRGWPRSASTALAIAELHLDAATSLQAASRTPVQTAAPTMDRQLAKPVGESSNEGFSKKQKLRPKASRVKGGAASGGHSAAIEHHLTAAEAQVALRAAATASHSDVSSNHGTPDTPLQSAPCVDNSANDDMETDDAHETPRPAKTLASALASASASSLAADGDDSENADIMPQGQSQQQQQQQEQLRWMWLLGRLADARKRRSDAREAFQSCRALLSSMQHTGGSHAGGTSPQACAPRSTGSHSPVDAERRRAAGILPPQAVLPGCTHDAVIRLPAIDGKLQAQKLHTMLEAGTEKLEAQQHGVLVQELEPLVVGEAVKAGGWATAAATPESLAALRLLQDAAVAGGVAYRGTALWAALLRANALLPQLPADLDELHDEDQHKGAISAPAPPGVASLQDFRLGPSSTAAGFAAREAIVAVAGGFKAPPEMLALLRHVIWQVVLALEACYWSIAKQAALEATSGKAAVGKHRSKVQALVELCVAVSGLQALDYDAPQEPVEVEALLAAAAGLLADQKALTSRGGTFLSLAISRLGAASASLHSCPPPGVDGMEAASVAADRAAAQATVDGALAHCVHALHGLDLPWRPPTPWAGIPQVEPLEAPIDSLASARALWTALRPRVVDIFQGGPSAKLSRLSTLTAVLAPHFAPLAAPALLARDPDKLLDDVHLDEDCQLAASQPALERAQHAAAQEAAAAQDSDILSDFFQLQVALQPELDTTRTGGVLLLGEEADAALERHTRPARAEVALHPSRPVAWEQYSAGLRAALELAHNEACAGCSPEQWNAPTLEQPVAAVKARISMLRTRALKATLVARQLSLAESAASSGDMTAAAAEEAGSLDEALGQLYFERVQRTTPEWDGRSTERPAGAADAARRALSYFQAAAAALPQEWSLQLYIGKILHKTQAPLKEVLHHLALSVRLSAAAAGGAPLLEPFYALHAARLKALDAAGNQPDIDQVAAIGRHCFSAAAAAAVDSVFQSPSQTTGPRGSSDAAALAFCIKALRADCRDALAYVLERNKYFHRARHRLAMSDLAANDKQAALEQLRPLFSRRTGFGLSFEYITADTKGESRRNRRRTMEPALAADVAEELWGRRPSKTSGNGLGETPHKHGAALRRSLLHFLRLAAACGDDTALEGAATVLQLPPPLTAPTAAAHLQDFARLAVGLYLSRIAEAVGFKRSSITRLTWLTAHDIAGQRADVTFCTTLERCWQAALRHVAVGAEDGSGWHTVVLPALQEAVADAQQADEHVDYASLAPQLQPQHFVTAAIGHLAMLGATNNAAALAAALQLLRRRRRSLAAASSADVAGVSPAAAGARLACEAAAALSDVLQRELLPLQGFVARYMESSECDESADPPLEQQTHAFQLLRSVAMLARVMPSSQDVAAGRCASLAECLQLGNPLQQPDLDSLLSRCYVMYEELCGYSAVPQAYSGADALKGCEMLVKSGRGGDKPPKAPPIEPSGPRASGGVRPSDKPPQQAVRCPSVVPSQPVTSRLVGPSLSVAPVSAEELSELMAAGTNQRPCAVSMAAAAAAAASSGTPAAVSVPSTDAVSKRKAVQQPDARLPPAPALRRDA